MNKDELMALGIEESIAQTVAEENEAMRKEYEDKISSIKRENEIDIALRNSGAKNLKVVRALLGDADDFVKQIEELKANDDTRFLFETKKGFTPYRSGERLPGSKSDEYRARLEEARKRGDTLGAIRIKQAAATEGIMLI